MVRQQAKTIATQLDSTQLTVITSGLLHLLHTTHAQSASRGSSASPPPLAPPPPLPPPPLLEPPDELW